MDFGGLLQVCSKQILNFAIEKYKFLYKGVFKKIKGYLQMQ